MLYLPIKEYGVDVLVSDGRFLGAGGHAEGPEEVGDEAGQLAVVLLLTLHHAEDDAVALAHALGVGRPDVQLHDLLPAPPTQPAAEETLNLWQNTDSQHLYAVVYSI